MSVPAAIVDRQGTVTWINNPAREVLGNRVGHPFVSVVAPENVELVGRQLEPKLSGQAGTDYERARRTLAPRATARAHELGLLGE